MKQAFAAACIAVALAVGGSWAEAQEPAEAQELTLLEAVRTENRTAALALLAGGADVDTVDDHGTTALHWAVLQEDAQLVARLLEAGADVSARNDYDATPMSEAALTGNVEVLQLLLDAGADPDSPNSYGHTALMSIARTSNVAAAELLLRHGADVNAREQLREQTPLMLAAAHSLPELKTSQADMVRLLVEHGADVDARSHVNQWDRQVSAEPRALYRPAGGLTPLLFAARQGCLDCARILVEAGADLDLPDPEGKTPLIFAINNLHFDLAAYLLDQGASVDRWDWYGRTPLYAAVDMNTLPAGGRQDRPSLSETTSLELIERILEAGADPNAQLKLRPLYRSMGDRGCDNMISIGTTPLLRAAKVFDAPAIELLLAYGADPNLPQVIGLTPVMAAAGLGSWDCDSRGNDIYVRSDVERRSIRALELLLDAGGEINAQSFADRREYCCPVPDSGQSYQVLAGQTPVHGAAFWGWNDVVSFLVERGADLQIADARGMTPRDAALGRAGGNGFYGQRIDVHEGTAALIDSLLAERVSQR